MTRAEHDALAIIAEISCVPVTEIDRANRLDDELAVDSLDRMELTFALEEKFDIDISDAAMEAAETVGQVVDLVERLMKMAAEDRP